MKPDSTDDDITKPAPAGHGGGPVYWNPPQQPSPVSKHLRKKRSSFLPVILTMVLATSATTAFVHLYEDLAHPVAADVEFLPGIPHENDSTTSPHVVAAFPPDSRAMCGSDSNYRETSLSPLTNPRVRIGSNFANSCGFIESVVEGVDAQVAKTSTVQSFQLTVSTPRNGRAYPVQCQRMGHLSRCVVGGESTHVIYVLDPFVNA